MFIQKLLHRIFIIDVIILVLFSLVAFAETKKTALEPHYYTEKNTAIVVTSSDKQFTLKLKSNPTTGYSWFLRDYDKEMIKPIKHVFQRGGDQKLVGAPGYEYWTFEAKAPLFSVPQQTTIRMISARPWQSESSDQLVFQVTSTP